jgi:hypothetical protein
MARISKSDWGKIATIPNGQKTTGQPPKSNNGVHFAPAGILKSQRQISYPHLEFVLAQHDTNTKES